MCRELLWCSCALRQSLVKKVDHQPEGRRQDFECHILPLPSSDNVWQDALQRDPHVAVEVLWVWRYCKKHASYGFDLFKRWPLQIHILVWDF